MLAAARTYRNVILGSTDCTSMRFLWTVVASAGLSNELIRDSCEILPAAAVGQKVIFRKCCLLLEWIAILVLRKQQRV